LSKKRTVIKGIAIAIVVVIALLFALTGFITDLLWFKELGYISVFLTKLFTQLKIGIPVFLHIYLDLFSGVIQTYVFAMLTMVWITDKYGD
jgi:uncharacterized membrane protein (UPF0182 family)